MIHPINNHLIIKPLTNESFVATQRETYEEIGVVVECPEYQNILKKGDRVYFDSWLAAKYPTGTGKEFFWLVKFDDVRAYEPAEN